MINDTTSSLDDFSPPRTQLGATHITDSGQPSKKKKKQDILPKANLQFAVRLSQPWIDALNEMYPGYSPGIAIRKYIETHIKPKESDEK